MHGKQPSHPEPSHPDGDGVRIIRRQARGGRSRRWAQVVGLLLAVVAGAVYLLDLQPTQSPAAVAVEHVPVAPPTHVAVRPLAARRAAPTVPYEQELPDDFDVPSSDPDDLASYIAPSDRVPSMAEVITALHDVGIHEGLGAFNPPGTSPPLAGLAVPEDFDLPEGYVRHYQVTDEGVPIEPILMFSPDFEFYDDDGNAVALPENRVVPPELAPPGLPIQPVEIPAP